MEKFTREILFFKSLPIYAQKNWFITIGFKIDFCAFYVINVFYAPLLFLIVVCVVNFADLVMGLKGLKQRSATRDSNRLHLLIAWRSQKMFRRRLRLYQRSTDGMPIARLVPLSARAEATVPEYPETYHQGIHRHPILSRDLAERHARKLADMRVEVYISMRVHRVPFPLLIHYSICDCEISFRFTLIIGQILFFIVYSIFNYIFSTILFYVHLCTRYIMTT